MHFQSSMTLSKSYCVLTVKFDLFYLREEVEVLNVCTLDYSGANNHQNKLTPLASLFI